MIVIARIPKNAREEYRVTSETFKGTPLVHLRIWYVTDNNEYAPAHRGVAIHLDQVPSIISAIQEIEVGGDE